MKTALLYSFLAVLTTTILSFILFLFLGNEMAKNATLLLNILIVIAYTYLYYKTANPNLYSFILLLVANSLCINLIIFGAITRQGLSFFTSIYFWGQTIERIVIPVLYEKFLAHKS